MTSLYKVGCKKEEKIRYVLADSIRGAVACWLLDTGSLDDPDFVIRVCGQHQLIPVSKETEDVEEPPPPPPTRDLV
jgi:hypothetical protein